MAFLSVSILPRGQEVWHFVSQHSPTWKGRKTILVSQHSPTWKWKTPFPWASIPHVEMKDDISVSKHSPTRKWRTTFTSANILPNERNSRHFCQPAFSHMNERTTFPSDVSSTQRTLTVTNRRRYSSEFSKYFGRARTALQKNLYLRIYWKEI